MTVIIISTNLNAMKKGIRKEGSKISYDNTNGKKNKSMHSITQMSQENNIECHTEQSFIEIEGVVTL